MRTIERRRHLTDKICGIPANRQWTDNKGNYPKQSVVRRQLLASRPLKNIQLSLSAVIRCIKS